MSRSVIFIFSSFCWCTIHCCWCTRWQVHGIIAIRYGHCPVHTDTQQPMTFCHWFCLSVSPCATGADKITTHDLSVWLLEVMMVEIGKSYINFSSCSGTFFWECAWWHSLLSSTVSDRWTRKERKRNDRLISSSSRLIEYRGALFSGFSFFILLWCFSL